MLSNEGFPLAARGMGVSSFLQTKCFVMRFSLPLGICREGQLGG